MIRQDPAGGSSVDEGATVTIVVSTGVERVQVPDVTGLGARLASSQLRQAGLVAVERTRTVTDPAQDGIVVEQRPGSGELEARRLGRADRGRAGGAAAGHACAS